MGDTQQVAPGMQVCYVVTFKPQDVRAYAVELFALTEREKFVVPVEALGHRAVLDFPDKVRASLTGEDTSADNFKPSLKVELPRSANNVGPGDSF